MSQIRKIRALVSRLRSRLKRSTRLYRVLFTVQNCLAIFRPNCTASQPRRQPKYRCSAMVRVKNDAPFIREWMAHHFALGVEHFYVYDNGSTDNTVQEVRDLIDNGLVTLVDFPMVPITPSSMFHFFHNFAWETEWCCFFDSDEFLMLPFDMDIHQLISAQPTAPAIAINWRYMGSGWHNNLPTGLLTEHLIHGDRALDRHIKVIARTRDVRRFRNSHNFYYRLARTARTHYGDRVYGAFSEVRDSTIWLGHYVYRGDENYLYKARQRPPEGATSARNVDSRREQYELHNEAIVRPSPEVIARTKRQMAAWNALLFT